MKRSWNRLWFLVVLLPGLLFLVVNREKDRDRETDGAGSSDLVSDWYSTAGREDCGGAG